jgi:hypothetical protein
MRLARTCTKPYAFGRCDLEKGELGLQANSLMQVLARHYNQSRQTLGSRGKRYAHGSGEPCYDQGSGRISQRSDLEMIRHPASLPADDRRGGCQPERRRDAERREREVGRAARDRPPREVGGGRSTIYCPFLHSTKE